MEKTRLKLLRLFLDQFEKFHSKWARDTDDMRIDEMVEDWENVTTTYELLKNIVDQPIEKDERIKSGIDEHNFANSKSCPKSWGY